MTDILIRGVPAEQVAAIDEMAKDLGLSRNDFLRREVQQVAGRRAVRLTMQDLEDFCERYADLGDPEVMRQAWS
ncbi:MULTISPECIES: type II toxin-antitoxin system VapB family antitoxin [unclassified Luteococcus]|uniref:type II toxin-antitoxin system VapB family antitoxin n=1 Tax=unclassified Luteococcus TaxID=2639923 RepID=UPI00313B07DA